MIYARICFTLQNILILYFSAALIACTTTQTTSFHQDERYIWDSLITQKFFEIHSLSGVFEKNETKEKLSYQYLISPINGVKDSAFGVTVNIRKASQGNPPPSPSSPLFGPNGSTFNTLIMTDDKKYWIESNYFQTGIDDTQNKTFDDSQLLDIGNIINRKYKQIKQ